MPRLAQTALMVAAMLSSSNAVGSPLLTPLPAGGEEPPRLVANVCAAVGSQVEELEPLYTQIMYQYQSLIALEAGVSPLDTKAEFDGKMRDWLNRNLPRLLCGGFNFTPQGGNILKLAISAQSDSFIDDAVRTWAVELNHVDIVDGQTVLDYIEAKRVAAGSNANLNRIYTRYYDRFRAAGARHASELR